jgi:hypothetical protein
MKNIGDTLLLRQRRSWHISVVKQIFKKKLKPDRLLSLVGLPVKKLTVALGGRWTEDLLRKSFLSTGSSLWPEVTSACRINVLPYTAPPSPYFLLLSLFLIQRAI